MAGSARSWGALLALLVGAASSLACGVEAGAQDPAAQAQAASAAAHAKLEAMQAAGALQEAVRTATARVEAEPDSLEARLGMGEGLVRGRPLSGRRHRSGGVSRHALRPAHAGPRGIRFPLGSSAGRGRTLRRGSPRLRGRGRSARPRPARPPRRARRDRARDRRSRGRDRALRRAHRRLQRRHRPERRRACRRWRPPAAIWARPIRSSSRTRSRRSTRRSPPTGARSSRASR